MTTRWLVMRSGPEPFAVGDEVTVIPVPEGECGVSETWATAGYEAHPGPQAFVQWKGTDVCLDLHCACGHHGHFDGDFAYGLRCAQCGAVWMMPHTFGVLPAAEGDVTTQDTFDPSLHSG